MKSKQPNLKKYGAIATCYSSLQKQRQWFSRLKPPAQVSCCTATARYQTKLLLNGATFSRTFCIINRSVI
jgi:hypothetical protein